MNGEEAPKIGVFLCHCGTNIAGVVDVPSVAEYARRIPGVYYVEENLHTCSSEGINHIKEAIEREGLERVVVAACTPRTHEQLFMEAVEEAGLNRYLFQMVNVREQDSWVHGDKDAATAKAKQLVHMAVAKATYLEPEERRKIDVTPTSLVVGAGVAGMTAALALAEQGFQVILVEKEGEPGGLVKKLFDLSPTNQDAEEFLAPMIDAVRSNDNIQLFTSSKVVDVSGFIGHFNVGIKSNKNHLSTEVGTIIVATGAEVFTPDGYYSYGETPNIVTQLELEEKLREGSFKVPDHVAFIQCVGSMEEKGRTYCSRICCGVALKNAIRLKELNPDADIHILYRELQAYGVELEALYREALSKEVKFINYVPERPPEVSAQSGGINLSVYDTLQGSDVELQPGLVVLSTPLVQHEEGRALAKLLRVPLGSDGFFLEAHPKMRPVDFSSDGIYLCGTAHAPKNIAESVTQGYAAASRAAIPMRLGEISIDAVSAVLDPELCVGCGACASGCPFDAIEWMPSGKPHVIEAACKGCGVCTVECPVGAMQLRYFKDKQLVPAVRALMQRTPGMNVDDSSNPTVLVFACRWCSYAAADYAGVMRLSYPANVRILMVPCTGRVDFRHIYEGFSSGADGVIVIGCLKEQCHYTDGNIIAERRVEVEKKAIEVLGISGDRLEMLFCSAGMPREFAEYMRSFTERIKRLGKIERETVRAFKEIEVEAAAGG